LAAATIARISRTCAARLAEVVGVLRERVAAAPVKHLDETGFRIGGKTQWLHVAATALLTFYRTCRKRGSMLANVVGTVVHDHWKPYYTMPGVDHALCNAHHLRELKALIEIEKEDWARKMAQLLRRACHATNLAAGREGALTTLKPRLIGLVDRRYDAIIAAGLAYHEAQPALGRTTANDTGKPRGRVPRRTGHNLLLRLQSRKTDVLRFLHDAAVPFTNNRAEGDLRMMKVKQKISGGFRSEQGASDFATIRSFISTAKKHRWNIIEALAQEPQILISALSPG
jgi:transposase